MKKAWRVIGCIILGAFFLIVFGWITMMLWNWLVPALFAGPAISFVQALGLLALSKILLLGRGSWYCKGREQGNTWRNKLSSMTPEEREAFKKKMKNKWCSYDRSNNDGPDNSNV